MRHFPRWAVLAVIVVACGQAAISSAEGSDGILDCAQGQVTRSADIEARGATEEEAAEKALAEWKSQGATLVLFPEAEVWSAVMDGRDVAVAVVEQNGDGTWVTHDVSICGEPDTGAAPIDGTLDCANGYRWVMQAGIDPSVPGEPTPEEALRFALEPFQKRYGGEIVFVDEDTASLVVQQRERVTANAVEVPAGGWAVSSVEGCQGYEP